MSHQRFEFVVIGGGPAGQKAAIQGAKAGHSVLLVDKMGHHGGECVHRGTIPSKTLRETALWISGYKQHAHLEEKVSCDRTVDNLMRRLDSVRTAHERFLEDQIERNGVERWHGRARFTGGHQVTVEAPGGPERTVEGDHFLIATGSRPRTPNNVPIDHEHILDSDSILSMIYLPTSIVVLGAGVIACEFASIFASLGVRVTMIDKSERPLGFMDEELVERFLAHFASLGGTFLQRRVIDRVEWNGTAVEARLEGGEVIRSEKMLCALGRVACVRDLNLDLLGVEVNERGVIPVDEFCRTSVPHVYAAGDSIGPPALAASSMEQGRRAARHALGLPDPKGSGVLPVGIYTIPEMASVGITEVQAMERSGEVLVGRADFAELARGQIVGDTEGMLKLVADPSGRELLGAHIVGVGATELIHVAQMAMVGGCDLESFVDNIFNFPTMAEAYRVAALQIVQAAPRELRRVS